MSYSVLTPYIIPPELKTKKAVNIGDGFILNAIQKLLHPFPARYLFTTRKKLNDIEIRKINKTKALILAGANQLNDNFTIAPGMSLEQIQQIEVPIIPFGIGIHGIPHFNTEMSLTTQAILREIHRRLTYSSWRCDLSLQYLNKFLPDLNQQFLLTGCPVMYDNNILSQTNFSETTNKIVVTITDREDFWEREKETINFVSHKYPSSAKFLSLHQDFNILKIRAKASNWLELLYYQYFDHLPSKSLKLRDYAKSKGFKIFRPQSVTDCLKFYDKCDLHIGSRVHAHLYFLSQGKKSFVTYVDERCLGFSTTFNFPICDYNNLEEFLDYNFQIYRESCQKGYQSMQKFVTYLKDEIL